MSDKVKWYMPSAEVEKVFGVLDSQMDIIWEQITSRCGLPTRVADERQTLSTESNQGQARGETVYKYLYQSFYQLTKLSSLIKVGENKEVKQETQETFKSFVSGGDANDNAVDENADGQINGNKKKAIGGKV
jgi:hypothetical protein